MPIRRSVNASSRETPPKSKPAEGEEVKAGTVIVLERVNVYPNMLALKLLENPTARMKILLMFGSLSQDLCFADAVFSLNPLVLSSIPSRSRYENMAKYCPF